MTGSKHVVLVTEDDEILGISSKNIAHNSDTQLHRGVSAFLFNHEGKFLIQKRHNKKITWPSFWSNSFCGHPQINETYEQAVVRHARFELDISLEKICYAFNYRYQFSYNNVVENEICPVYIVFSNEGISPNSQEIDEFRWVTWSEFKKCKADFPDQFTPWCIEESSLLEDREILQTEVFSRLLSA